MKLNATDQLTGGLEEAEALTVVSALDKTGIDLMESNGGTYFPGAIAIASAGTDLLGLARALMLDPIL